MLRYNGDFLETPVSTYRINVLLYKILGTHKYTEVTMGRLNPIKAYTGLDDLFTKRH